MNSFVAFLMNSLQVCLVSFLIIGAAVCIVRVSAWVRLAKLRRQSTTGDRNPRIIAFFHPFCDAMGGGEKVLFQALKAIQQDRQFDNDQLYVYSGAS